MSNNEEQSSEKGIQLVAAENAVFLCKGNTYIPADKSQLNVVDRLPIATYTVKLTSTGMVLEQIANMDVPGKLYGDVDKKANRILNTFHDRSSSTGALFSGSKGCGKTMLTKRISQLGLQQGVITIVINQSLHGEGFNTFLQGIKQPSIVIFDEFEKVYDREDQERLLTLLDGTYTDKKMFVLTCNDSYKVNEYMHNRPGRLYYSLEFTGLDKEFVREYCQDELNDKSQIDGVVMISSFFANFSFDQLKALVEEMNRYGEPAVQAVEMLNMKPTSDHDFATYTIDLVTVDGKPVPFNDVSETELRKSPLALRDYCIRFYGFDEDDDDDLKEIEKGGITEIVEAYISQSKLKSVNTETGIFTFYSDDPAYCVVFTRKKTQAWDWKAF